MLHHPLRHAWHFLILLLALLALQLPVPLLAAPIIGMRAVNDTIGCVVVPPSPPPPGFVAPAQEPRRTAGDVLINDVPAFSWCYGCSPTAAGMMMGYYDRHGYPNLYTGPANGGVCPLSNDSVWGYNSSTGLGECPFIASHFGIDGRATRGYVDDYWNNYNEPTHVSPGGGRRIPMTAWPTSWAPARIATTPLMGRPSFIIGLAAIPWRIIMILTMRAFETVVMGCASMPNIAVIPSPPITPS